MTALLPILGPAGVLAGAALLLAGARLSAPDGAARAYLVEAVGADLYAAHLERPLFVRTLWPLVTAVAQWAARITPAQRLEAIEQDLARAGLAGWMRAEELVAIQALLAGCGVAVGVGWAWVTRQSGAAALASAALFGVVGGLAMPGWLRRAVAARRQAIRRDLPDVLDLLAISVEAGLGFEAALELASRTFHSPLAEELGHTIHEMELGRPRREALQHLKRRVDVPEVSMLVLALTQADALGMPIGRVLHAQADEMRARRRQWARERAAKLPVKILFPIILFIFPAVLVVVMGPAVMSVAKALR